MKIILQESHVLMGVYLITLVDLCWTWWSWLKIGSMMHSFIMMQNKNFRNFQFGKISNGVIAIGVGEATSSLWVKK